MPSSLRIPFSFDILLLVLQGGRERERERVWVLLDNGDFTWPNIDSFVEITPPKMEGMFGHFPRRAATTL